MMQRFFITLLSVNTLLILLHIFFGDRFDLFNLDRERTPGAYWSGLQLMAIAALSAGMILLSASRRDKMLWGAFSFLFVGFSFDEISELHENITYYLSTYLHIPTIFRSMTYNWLIILSPLIIFAFVFLFFFLRTLRQENMLSRKLLSLGILFFLAAIGVELANGLDADQLSYFWSVVLEESLELLGETAVLLGVASIAHDRFDRQYARRV